MNFTYLFGQSLVILGTALAAELLHKLTAVRRRTPSLPSKAGNRARGGRPKVRHHYLYEGGD